MTDRDYNFDMIVAIDKLLPKKGDFRSGEIAEKLVAQLEETDPDLLSGWLHDNARTFLSRYVSDHSSRSRMASNRNAATTRAEAKAQARSVFSDAATAFEQGDARPLTSWLQSTYAVDDENTRKRLVEMNKDELEYVQRGHERRSKEAKFEALYIAAIRKKVTGSKTVGDVWKEDQLAKLRDTIEA